MKESRLFIATFFAWSLVTEAADYSVHVDVRIDAHANAKFRECDKYAERIREGVQKYIQSNDAIVKNHIARNVKKNKKKLRKCEAREEFWFNQAIQMVNGGTISFNANF